MPNLSSAFKLHITLSSCVLQQSTAHNTSQHTCYHTRSE